MWEWKDFFLTCPLFDFDFELRFSWSSERRWESGGIGSKAVKKCRSGEQRRIVLAQRRDSPATKSSGSRAKRETEHFETEDFYISPLLHG